MLDPILVSHPEGVVGGHQETLCPLLLGPPDHMKLGEPLTKVLELCPSLEDGTLLYEKGARG